MREHITLGYASTVHAAQGMTIGNSTTPGVCWTILSDRASRAMAYVGMTRARNENHLAIYPAAASDATQQGADTAILQLRRGTKHIAAHHLRAILANDDRARTMHTVAARTNRARLPAVIAAVLDRNDQRRAERARAWRRRTAQDRARETAYQRMAVATRETGRERSRQGYGLEL